MEFIERYLKNVASIASKIDKQQIENMISLLEQVHSQSGRIFFIGVGGGAGNASHAVNDFRMIAGIESYTPTNNVSELTARINDEGWDTAYVNWLKGSKLCCNDMVFVFSVGGGDSKRNISVNIVKSLQYAKQVNAKICGIIGRDGGYTAKVADACCIIPTVDPSAITSLTESFQAVVWHLLVTHNRLQKFVMKWESVK